MGKLIIDTHSHLWLKQDTEIDGKRILSLQNGRSIFLDEEVQMLPPFMIDGRNTAEVFLSNMDYAQVAGAVVVQEVIDGCQNDYLANVQKRYPNRFFCMGMAWNQDEAKSVISMGLKGIAFPGHRMRQPVIQLMPVFKLMEEQGLVLSMCLSENERQIGEMREVIQECPKLRVAIGHFGMVTTPAFRSQVMLAREGKNVMIESGGITWLFHREFYPYPSAIRAIKEAAEWVGMERLMWGSDYPRTITAITYRMSYDFVSKSNELSDTDKDLFLGENARLFYGFHNLPELPYIKNMSE
ncbi:MAG: amidohydrolase [Bacteroidaceae bacterium]|nr:amidohydrolase [Bacteroidaceae bacterium]